MRKMRLLFVFVVILFSNFQANVQLFAQESVCPEYIEHFEYAAKIKYCPGGGGGFITWEDCVFRAGGLCPCPMVHEQPCPGEA